MSHFPTYETFSEKISKQHLTAINIPQSFFMFKKHKGVYLYDLDGNKFTDFSLQSGEIFSAHSPNRLTKFMKNALSYGIGHANAYPKFLYKATQLWKKYLGCTTVTFFPNFLMTILEITHTLKKKEITIGVNSEYLIKKLAPISHLITIINILEQKDRNVDLLLIEDIPHLKNEDTANIHASKKIKVHSRFFFRRSEMIFDPKWDHLITATPFGGKDLTIVTGAYQAPYISSEDGILFLEGAKDARAIQKQKVARFIHPLITYYNGYGIARKKLDPDILKKHGIIIDHDEYVFFSPEHTLQDFKRLSRVLDLFLE
ncbi:MAG: hypothetical protein ACRCV0_01905 [Brevinema sp.]